MVNNETPKTISAVETTFEIVEVLKNMQSAGILEIAAEVGIPVNSGQKQCIGIARALAVEPDFIVPTNSSARLMSAYRQRYSIFSWNSRRSTT